MTTQFDCDVFISHVYKDKLVARELASRLKQDGRLDEWEIQPGDIVGLRILPGLEHSCMLLFDDLINA